jgi:hypothetical protein
VSYSAIGTEIPKTNKNGIIKKVLEVDSDSDTVSVSNSSEVGKEKSEGSDDCIICSEETNVEEKPSRKRKAPELEVKLKALEIFCGCARLTLSLTKEGFDATGVDFIGNKDKPEGKTVLLDASTSWGQRKIKDKALSSSFVPMAPPCGTASKSRDKRVKFGPDPKPLRSDQWPDGFPWLKGTNRDRVHNANKL